MATDKPAGSSETKSTVVTVKETLESIVVAFVLAFVFRAFIVEAFVIPTGSMAVTLYGEQLTKTCSTCGFEYALGVNPAPGRLIDRPRPLRCPNCDMGRDEFSRSELDRPDSGDRILVHKWPFDLPFGRLGPQRWDVTVFKDPKDGRTNFIKRLVGKPGEVLEIIDGDVYTAGIDAIPKEALDQFEQLRLQVYDYGHGESGTIARPTALYQSINKMVLPCLRIQRKIDQSPRAQQSLWCNVYNHDLLPNYPKDSTVRVGWVPENAAAKEVWNTSQRTIRFKSEDDQTHYIRLDGKPIDDFNAYNYSGGREYADASHCPVGDLRLRLSWLVRRGSGDLVLEMNRDRDKFIATFSANGQVKLEAERPDTGPAGSRQPVVPPKRLASFAREHAVRLEFMIVDYRVLIMVDDEVVVRTNDDQYRPSLKKLEELCQALPADDGLEAKVKPSVVKIGARGMECELAHLILERDVYYRSQLQMESGNRYGSWPGWGTAGFPLLLRPERRKDGKVYPAEYFMLGDNSPASKDSRLWWEIGEHLKYLGNEYQVGTVPEDQLIGKAFFVYWPAGYRPSWAGGIGLIPNFGRMRWIR